MKKLLFTLLFALPVMAFAQSTANVAVETEVNANLTLTADNINLGEIEADVAAVLDANANDDAEQANVGAAASPGSLQIEGTDGATVSVSFTNATLTDGSGANATTFTPSVWLGANEVTSGGTVTLADGDVTLDVGGELGVIATANIGSYSTGNSNGSPITFTVTYN